MERGEKFVAKERIIASEAVPCGGCHAGERVDDFELHGGFRLRNPRCGALSGNTRGDWYKYMNTIHIFNYFECQGESADDILAI
jgi:hypothetical protein